MKNSYLERFKNEPELLENSEFALDSLGHLSLSLKDYPEQYRKNELFLYQYFIRTSADVKEYRFIPEHFMSNPFFLSPAIRRNPDLYLLLEEKNISVKQKKELYQIIAQTYPQKILKYAGDELLQSFSFCEQAIQRYSDNYQYAPEFVKTNEAIINRLFKTIQPIVDCPLARYIPEKLFDNPKFSYTMLSLNLGTYPYFPKHVRGDKNLALYALSKSAQFFPAISEELQHDPEVIEYVLNFHKKIQHLSSSELFSQFSHIHFRDSAHYQLLANYSIVPLLINLPLSFYDKEQLEYFQKDISESFALFPKSHRKDPDFIQAAFTWNKDTDTPNEKICDGKYINLIQDKNIQKDIGNIISENRNLRKQGKIFYQTCQKHIERYFSARRLERELDKKEFTTSRMKI